MCLVGRLLNDGLQEIAEYEGVFVAGSPARTYVFGSYIDEPLVMVSGGVKTYYHTNNLYSVAALTDAAGAVVERMTYDPYGKVTILAADGTTVLAVSNVGNPWTFTGRRLDGETGLMYYRARMYSVELGRFIGRDPIVAIEEHIGIGVNRLALRVGLQPIREFNDQSWYGYSEMNEFVIRIRIPNSQDRYRFADYNLYSYGGNAPTIRIDPSGTIAPIIVCCVLGGILWLTGCGDSGPKPLWTCKVNGSKGGTIGLTAAAECNISCTDGVKKHHPWHGYIPFIDPGSGWMPAPVNTGETPAAACLRYSKGVAAGLNNGSISPNDEP